MNPDMPSYSPSERGERIDWIAMKNNEEIQSALERILAEAQASSSETSSMSSEDFVQHLQDFITAKGYEHGVKILVNELGQGGERTVTGFTNSPIDGKIIYF